MDHQVREIQIRLHDLMEKEITRPGAKALLSGLQKIGFYDAPASSQYHCCFWGGLAVHTLLVYEQLKSICASTPMINEEESRESIAVVALCHDLCKCFMYTSGSRWTKESGRWEQVPSWQIEDGIPLGHGEKSLYVAQQFIRLTPEEACAVRFHMGYFEQSAHTYPLSKSLENSFSRYPLAKAMHLADMSTFLYEEELRFYLDGQWHQVPEGQKFPTSS